MAETIKMMEKLTGVFHETPVTKKLNLEGREVQLMIENRLLKTNKYQMRIRKIEHDWDCICPVINAYRTVGKDYLGLNS